MSIHFRLNFFFDFHEIKLHLKIGFKMDILKTELHEKSEIGKQLLTFSFPCLYISLQSVYM